MSEESIGEREHGVESDRKNRRAGLRSAAVMAVIFVAAVALSILISPLFTDKGMKAFENEDAVVNPLIYIVFIIAFTAVVLYIVKKGKKNLIKYFFLGAIFLTVLYVFAPLLDAAVYGYGEKWEHILAGEDIVSMDATRHDGVKTYCFLDGEGTLHVRTSDGREGQFGNAVRKKSSGTVAIVDLCSLSEKKIFIEVSGGGAGLFLADTSGDDLEINALAVHKDEHSAGYLQHNGTDNHMWTAVSIFKRSQEYHMNVTIYDIPVNGNGTVGASPVLNREGNISGINGTDEIRSVLIVPAAENELYIAVAASDEMLLYNSTSLMLDERLSLDGIAAMRRVKAGGHGDDHNGDGERGCGGCGSGGDGCEDEHGGTECGYLLLSTNNSIHLFRRNGNNWSETAERKIKEGIGDIAVAPFDNEEGIFVLENGIIHVFRADDDLRKMGFTEEKQGSARGVAAADADDDGDVEIYVLTGNGARVFEVEPKDIHLWAWLVGAVAGIALVALVRYHPEWYVVDATGIIMAVGAMALIGISLAILPVLVMLVLLAVYDAISVYKTKHMISLADNVMEMRLPVLLVIPKERDYSFRKQKKLKEELDSGEERAAMFMGLGDVIIPGLLAVSAFTFLPGGTLAGIERPLLVAAGTVLGGLVGFTVLMRYVLRGNPQAGLPLLNGGTILGYLLSYLVVYQDIGFGLTFRFF